MDIDDIYKQIGESGRQQIKYGMAMWIIKAYTPFLILQYTFVARNTDFVCFRNWMSKSTMSSLMFGFLVGALVLGNLSDRIGRKTNMTFNLLGVIFFNSISSITTEFSVYILSSELVGASYRGIYGILITGAYPFGIVFLAFVANHVRDWRTITALTSVMGLPFLAYHWYLVESPRWLLNTNRNEEAKLILDHLANGNNNGESPKQSFTVKQRPSDSVKEYVWHLYGKDKIMKIMAVLAFNWFVNGATYYGLTLASGDIGTDLYSGVALSGFVEMPAIFLSYMAIEKIGRRLALCLSMLISGVSCVLIQMLQGTSLAHLGISCALLGKLCIAGSFKIAYIMSSEILATSIRNSGMGVLSAAARVGSMLSPFIVMAGETYSGIQFTVFGILSLTGGTLSLLLPETKGKPLAENVSEMLVDKSKKIDTI